MSSRWDRDQKAETSRRDSRNGRGGRGFDSRRSPPRGERRMIKLYSSSSRGDSSNKHRHDRRSRSRDREKEVAKSQSPPLTDDRDQENKTVLEVNTTTADMSEPGAIEEGEISPILNQATTPPVGGGKNRWDSDSEDDSGSDSGSVDQAQGNDSDNSEGPPNGATQNGLARDGSSSNLVMAASPTYDGTMEDGREALPEVEVPAIIEHNPLLQGCRDVEIYEKKNRIAEGTYGVVYRAREKSTGKIYALKEVKPGQSSDSFPITAVREINIMLCLKHENIVKVQEMVIQKGKNASKVFMVMEYMEHDLKKVMDKMETKWTQSEAKCLLQQLLKAISFMHDKWYIHRDLKTSNLLYNNEGKLCVCDFGLARKYGEPIREYTTPVVTLYYRSPELLLGAKKYSTEIDMWSVGCIFAEILRKEPLFVGKCDLTQLDKIFSILGNPTEERWPGFRDLPGADKVKWKSVKPSLRSMFPVSSFAGDVCLSANGLDLLERMLTLDPKRRITAGDALKHDYFKEFPQPKSINMMPTYATEHD